jgi:hypothetical protein
MRGNGIVGGRCMLHERRMSPAAQIQRLKKGRFPCRSCQHFMSDDEVSK